MIGLVNGSIQTGATFDIWPRCKVQLPADLRDPYGWYCVPCLPGNCYLNFLVTHVFTHMSVVCIIVMMPSFSQYLSTAHLCVGLLLADAFSCDRRTIIRV